MMGYILYCDSGGFFALRSVLSSLYHVGLLGDTSIFFCLSSGQWSCVWVDLRSDSGKEVGQLHRVAENKAIYNHRQQAGGRDILWNLNVQYSILKCPPPVPILSQIKPVRVFFFLEFLYYPPIDAWAFPLVSFPQVSPPKPCVHYYSPPYVLHAPPISLFSIWSRE